MSKQSKSYKNEITNKLCKQMTDVKLWLLYSNTWNHLTVCKQMSAGSFKNVIDKMCLQIKDK